MKTNTTLSLFILATLSLASFKTLANTPDLPPLWQDISARSSTADATYTPRRLKLDEAVLSAWVDNRPNDNTALMVDLPLPDGRNIRASLHQVSVLSPALQEKFPNIHTWKITSDEADIISGRAEFTELGFHAMLRLNNGEQLLIEPDRPTALIAERSYRSFNRSDTSTPQSRNFSCGTHSEDSSIQWQRQTRTTDNTTQSYAQKPGKTLLNYDLAVAATGEYTQQFGGSKTSAYSAIITTVNRVNEIFEQELSLKLNLVSGTETVFTNPATDPFTNGSALLASYENQEALDSYVGSHRYDIGHVLGVSQGGDGIAVVSSVCENGAKAQGYTASNVLLGDGFIVDFVAHELGHQLGAAHTFNGTGQACGGGGRIAATAYEPGSGSTIMSYAGLCGSDNIQQNVDPQFHTGSIHQIRDLTHNGTAASCATPTILSNNLPLVNAGINRTIPARTPFILAGTASDTDGDKLLYGWDQINAGNASTLGTDTGNNALIKSNKLSASGLRSIPDIQRLLTTTQSFSTGESLPRSTRNMDFRLTVRDGKGSTASDDVRLSVYDTGKSFSITSPTTSLSSGSHEIIWNVADTHLSPINCSNVDIAYTNDQGTTFTQLKLNTPNDGSEIISLTSRAQNIRVKCSDNIFFALSATTPHIASLNGVSSQSNTTYNSGGGGSIPLPLLFIGGLLATLFASRRRKAPGARKSFKGSE